MTSKIKIFFLIPDLSYGGAQKTIVNLANTLSLEKNYIITIVVINNKKQILNLNQNIKLISFNSNRLLFCMHKFFLATLKFKPNLIISTTVHINILNILIKLLIRTKKTKFIIRESNPTFFRNDVSNFTKRVCRILYPYSDSIISLSNFVTEGLLSNIKNIKHKIYTIGNPIDIENITKQSEMITESNFKFNQNFQYICFCGRLSYQKNFEFIIKIISKIEMPNLRILVIGDGPEKNKLLNIIKNKNCYNNFIFLGYQNNPHYFIKRSKLFLLSSRWEGFGHVILESLVCETPVVCFNTPGINKDFLGHNEIKYYKSNDTTFLANKLKKLILNYNSEFVNFKPQKIYNKYNIKTISFHYKNIFLETIEN